MGQYLFIGIATRISANVKNVKEAFKSIGNFKKHFEQTFNRNGIYQMEETDGRIDLCLNPEVAEKEWLQFLDSFYKLRYTSDYGQADAIKEMSKTNNLQEWIDLADKKQYECYQSDFLQYFPMEIPDNPYLDLYLHLDLVLLSIDGKIFMEGYNDLFAFFTRIIREKLADYRLSDSLFVYITD